MRQAMVSLVVLVVCVAAATVVRAQVPTKDMKIRFHLGGNYEPYDFLVNEPGQPELQRGFGVDLAKALCAMFNLTCVTIRDNYEDCWTSDDYPGRGLQGGWYDACSTYTNTYLRQTGVEFGYSYTRERPAGILTRLDKKGKPVIHPMDTNLKGKKIGIVGGWATNAASLDYVRNGCTDELFTNFTTVTPKDRFTGPDAAVRALLEGEVDGVFLYSSLIEDRKGCKSDTCDASLYGHLGTKYAWVHTGITEYQANGTTLAFTRKGSDLNAFLNPLITQFIQTKEYAELCEQYQGQDIDCFPNEFSSDLSNGADMNAMTNKEREEFCSNSDDPDECLSCAGGHCGCSV